ncbi:hypothetical protein KIN20_019319 [Parelaphostrongylus tenuis]|uniref:Uncharacterized protein n=1 Tax=Parelaphostrongylus tenuis TaxID=148309 RepID=A0AAD5N229_PARTN|nr:hypothetical protein KIN20_019319 [Parelaphostrongylus tenuis]
MSSQYSIAGGGLEPSSEIRRDVCGLSKNALALRNQLASLPMSNALEFLASVRKIAREIDLEADAVSEELASIEESYPKILATLRG